MNRNHVVLAEHISRAALSSLGAALAWMNRRLLGQNQPDTARFTALAAGSPPGANGLFFWPALALERGPWWSGQPSGALLGLSQTHTEADMARATLEGLAIAARLMAERMEAHYGPVKGELLCVAGGADSPLVWQITADIFGQPVFVLQHVHASAAGMATLASIAAGNLTLAGAWSTQNLQWRVVEPSPHGTLRRPS
ncbi:MAG: FGGY-family carbohydrate kinase [Anaerolineae bacterium]